MNESIGLATQFEPGKAFSPEFLQAVGAVKLVIDEIVAERRQHPGDDMVSQLVTSRDEGGGLDDGELFGQINAICSAALGTTAATLCGALLMLITHPDQLDLLRRDPALIDSAIEECLRVHGPGIHAFTRFATCDSEVGKLHIPRHMPVIGAIQAGSFDPDEYPEPLRFDIRRNPSILAFGTGPHHCIGSRLGRLIMRKAVLAIIQRFPNLCLDDPGFEPHYTGFPGELCLSSLPLRF